MCNVTAVYMSKHS